MSINNSLNTGFAVFLDEDSQDAIKEAITTLYTDEQLAEVSLYPEYFDAENPFDDISDYDLEELYVQLLEKEYPLLGVHSYGSRSGYVDGYAVYIASTNLVLNIEDFREIDPTEEELAQLCHFQETYAPGQEASQKQWTHFDA